MIRSLVLIAALACTPACGSRDNEPVATPPGESKPSASAAANPANAKETRVFDVKSSADLLALRTEYMKLWESGFDGTLEINVAAGTYQAQGWNLGPPSDGARKTAPATIDVVLRGGPAAPPPPSSIIARNLRIEDMILTSEYQPWELIVEGRFTMKRTVIVDSRARQWDVNVPQLQILGRGQHGGGRPRAVRAAIEDCWFVRNFQSSDPAAMMGFGSVEQAPSYWESIAIDSSVFLGNAFKSELDIHFAREVTIRNTIFYKTWPDGVLINSTSSDKIVLEKSFVVVEDLAHIAAHGKESPPIQVGAGSHIYAKGWKPGGTVPAALQVAPEQIHDRAELAPRESPLAQALSSFGRTMPPADLKAKLDAVFAQQSQ